LLLNFLKNKSLIYFFISSGGEGNIVKHKFGYSCW
jgi:hypothetical protein